MPRVQVKPAGKKGLGVFAAEPITRGTIIGEYEGDLLTEEEVDALDDDEELVFLFGIDDGRYINPAHYDTPIKYINHSCEPNSESVEKHNKIFIKAIKNIEAGEEITYDYSLDVDENDDDEYTCHCGAKSCRGTMKDV